MYCMMRMHAIYQCQYPDSNPTFDNMSIAGLKAIFIRDFRHVIYHTEVMLGGQVHDFFIR